MFCASVTGRCAASVPRNVTVLLDALEATGFAARHPHPSDRRATLIQLTEKGAAAVGALATDQVEFARYRSAT